MLSLNLFDINEEVNAYLLLYVVACIYVLLFYMFGRRDPKRTWRKVLQGSDHVMQQKPQAEENSTVMVCAHCQSTTKVSRTTCNERQHCWPTTAGKQLHYLCRNASMNSMQTSNSVTFYFMKNFFFIYILAGRAFYQI